MLEYLRKKILFLEEANMEKWVEQNIFFQFWYLPVQVNLKC